MLRSTGFFRGIDCPFYAEYSEGKGSKNGCNRPYCHFRHSQQRRPSFGAPADVKKQRDLHTAQKEQGYDPFKPEFVRPQEQQNGESAASGDLSGALELVNKAIEEVRSEVEREKRKLSRIGDEPYDPSENTGLSSSEPKVKTPSSHMAYDPGSYQMTAGGYNPTPSCSKYTLDTDNHGSNSNSMEYVPTSVRKAPSRTHTPQLPSPPPSPKYSSSTSSSKCKYTVDNSRPSTDMEYDPLSNYSAGITVKSKRDKSRQAAKTELKTHKLQGVDVSDDECVVVAKKPRQQSVDVKKYTVSDSDGESSGTEYRPTSLSNLQQRKGQSGSLWEAVGKERKEKTEGTLNALTQRNKEDMSGDSDVQEVPKQSSEKKKATSRSSLEKSGKNEKQLKFEKEVNRTSKSGSNSSKDKESRKNSELDSAKKENKSHGKRDDSKNICKVKTSDKVHREGRDEKRSDSKSKAVEKVKTVSSKRDRETENGARETKKPKMLEKEKERSKYKDSPHKNGKLDSSKREKDLKKISKSSSSSAGSSSNSKGSSAHSKDKAKQNLSSSNGKRAEDKRRSQSLSHADLFGDESPEEAEPIEIDDDDDDEPEEVLVRKSADALKRGRLSKRKASELTPSSSDGEGDGAGQDEVDGVGFDFSSFQDDIDFDSDPMEECLRIFNESKDVKKEDKGRQAKQASRDSEEEKGPESTLSTLVPGQKKRVSHFVAKGNNDAPSKSVVRPYKRPTAQEVCYQRMQMAQQQAAQLSASVKAASQSSSPGFSGEKRRIAHRPNPHVPSSKMSPVDVKPAPSRVLSPSQTHQAIKTQTTAGILSKTASTVQQKRVAHMPTMKSTSMRRPVIPTEFGAKVPTNVRQRYLNTFIDECVKFCRSEEAAFHMALDEEKLVYERSSSKNIYLNVAVNTLKKLRSKSSSGRSPAPSKDSGSAGNRRAQSHEDVLGGRLAATTSFTVNRMGKQQEEKLTGTTLYRKLKTYLMTPEQLQEHGYPRANPEAPGKAIIYNLPEKKAVSDPFNKVCCRCGAEYKVNVNGSCVRKEECSFHWGRLRRQKVAGGWETSYSCCAAAVGTPGCQVAKQHVQDGRKESLDGYVTTFSKSLPPDGNGGVFALDCEMCYTKQGLELTRVTVIDSEMKVIYDTFVKPDSKVVDYNTRFSGVTEEDLENATISLRDVQAVLLSMFSAESILIGHSLESDLLALKLIHSSVVDTAIVFPHRLGLPYKRALRNLMADHLKRIIQDNVEGHDSSEDASACMELMMWKIKEDAKVKR
ncbi:uncharacterized protein V6R79_003554 [Siganus canaliculatus]